MRLDKQQLAFRPCTLVLLISLALFATQVVRGNVSGKIVRDGKSADGSLHGCVTDAVTKKPLPGVTVSAFVPGNNKIGNNFKEVQTDAEGYFRFPELPVSAVTVQFDKKGYQSCKRPGIAIKERTTVRLNIEFLPQELESGADNSEYPIIRLLQAY